MNRILSQEKHAQYVNRLINDWEQLRAAIAMMDVAEMNRIENEIKHRELMMNVGTRAAELLLSTVDEASTESALTATLELVGVSADVDWVHIWRNEVIDGELHFVMAYEWLSSISMASTNRLPIGQKFPYSARPQWKKMFFRGEYINGPIAAMSQEDRKFFHAYDTKSIVLIPLFLQDRFWGFISLTDCRKERVFPEDEINILRLISLMIASAVNRSEQAAKLREAHERTRLLLDAMPLACHLWNRDYTIFDCNEENTRMFNLDNKNVIKDHFYRFSPEYQPDGRLSSEKAVESIQKAFDEGLLILDWMHQTSDGTPIPTEVTLVRLPYEDDYVVAGYARDLREYNKMMEEIEQNKAKLEAANNAKSDFLASMSHEMRTPLNAVIGLSGLILEMEGLGEEAKSNLEKVYNAGTTLLNIVNDILDISKIEAGKLALIPGDYDMPSLINDTITQNILRIGEKPVEFQLDICPKIPTRLNGDDLRIKQILNNLLSNAFKYTKEGLVELGMRCEHEKNSDVVWITAWVSDTGIGIRDKDQERLFSNYSQVDMKANHYIEGTGLGLAIAKKMLDMMDGTITVESEYGKGSIFTVRFKQKFVTDTPIGESVVENLKRFKYSDNMRSKDARLVYVKMPYAKVLVVDDNITNLDVAKGLMKPYEMRIDCVTSGEEAIAAIRAEKVRYDAIFMDQMMPVMDGIEAMQRIRELGTDYAKNIPVIALTANAITGSKEMFLNKGFQAFLSKPINLIQLDAIIKRWVRDRLKDTLLPDSTADETSKTGDDNLLPEPAQTSKTPDRSARSKLSELPVLPELPEIPGISAKKVSSLYAGMMEIYLPVLHSFAENTPDLINKLRNVTAEYLPEYTIYVHGLKGAAAGIGAEKVREKAYELEMLAKQGDLQGVLDKNEALLRETFELIENISAWLKAKDDRTGKPHRKAPDPAILEELRRSLLDYDMNGIDGAMDRLESVDYDVNADLIAWLEERITESEFDDAAKRIEEVLNVAALPEPAIA